jgi:putative aldouronate transport system substrate-binding protein
MKQGKLRILFAVVGFAVFGLNACGKKEAPVEFTVFIPRILPENPYGWESHGDLPVFKELEKRTGVKVAYINGELQEITTMLAAKEYPEVMIFADGVMGANYPGGVEQGIADGIILDITALIPQHAPNYLRAIERSYIQEAALRTPSGKLTQIYLLSERPSDPDFGYMMREDWLRAAGFVNPDNSTKIPLTFAEWEAFLTYVRANGLNGSNKAPLWIAPLGFDYMNQTLNAAFGATAEFFQVNGRVKYGLLEDDFWRYLDFMRNWFARGLVDPNFYADMTKQRPTSPLEVMGMEGIPAQFAAFPAYHSEAFQIFEPTGRLNDPGYSLIPVPSPVNTVGETVHLQFLDQGSIYYIVISDKCKNPEKVLQWINYLYSDEGTLLMNYGIEGDAYTLVNGKPRFTERITNNPDSIPKAHIRELTSGGIFAYLGVNTNEADPTFDPKILQAQQTWRMQTDNAYALPNLTLPAESGAAGVPDAAMLTLFTYMLGFMGGQAGTDYRALADLARSGFAAQIQPLIELRQAAYNEYLARGR